MALAPFSGHNFPFLSARFFFFIFLFISSACGTVLISLHRTQQSSNRLLACGVCAMSDRGKKERLIDKKSCFDTDTLEGG